MKILRVRFENFGPFEDQPLDFGSGDGLHVVFGPNEAGKSSALRGLHALLFGFPHKTDDDFCHKTSEFRVHGVLQSAAGDRLECVRRKGQKGTLRAADDKKVLPDTDMAAMLGGLDEEQFQQLFGLDLARLQEGGKDIARGKGHLGEALFAAGAGMKGLRTLWKSLEARQGELYKANGKVQKIAVALREWKDQDALIRDSLLPVEEYEKAERADREARSQVADLLQQRDAVRAESQLLARYRAALPLIDTLLAARRRHAGVADAPLLPDGFDEQLTKARTDRIMAASRLAKLDADVEQLAQHLETDAPPPAILAEQAEIEAIRALVAAQATFATERTKADTFSRKEEAGAKDIFRELTGTKDWDRMSDLKPRDRDRAAILRLANEASGVRGAVAACER
ncbi:MAG: AAA family ATPase, partial [Gemmataceae bacterium]|nr:AAA family ATPase [Gemmataceae bacterium]